MDLLVWFLGAMGQGGTKRLYAGVFKADNEAKSKIKLGKK